MEIQIFNSILFGSLKPWKVNQADAKSYSSFIKKANATQDIIDRLNCLLEPNPELILPKTTEIQLIQPFYSIDLPEYYDTLSNYYCLLINTESQRIFNVFKIFSDSLKHPIDINHQTNKILRKIKILLVQVLEEIEEIGNEETPPKNFNLTEFVLSYLEKNLFVLYFNIQAINEKHLVNIISQKDFHVLELNQPINTLPEILELLPQTHIQAGNVKKQINIKVDNNTTNKPQTPKLSFGWKGNNKNTLHNLFDDLCIDINFLNEEKTTIENLVELLTAKEVVPSKINIYLGCKTTEFVFVIDNICKNFQRLTQTNIEKSKSFWTKEEIKKPSTLITSTNFSKSRGKTKMKGELKEEILATIQKHFP